MTTRPADQLSALNSSIPNTLHILWRSIPIVPFPSTETTPVAFPQRSGLHIKLRVLFAFCRFARLQHVLMDLQQQQLNQLSEFINEMEARINSRPPVGGSEQQVKHQLETHRVCMLYLLITSPSTPPRRTAVKYCYK